MESIKISIITVCYNAEKFLEKTICSVLEQDYKQIEYIIIDGNSKDNTVPIILMYCKKNEIKWITEDDQGIYDAMNKGIKLATGDYVQFLNAGDTFCDSSIIKRVADFITSKKADLYYGHIVYQYPNRNPEIRKYGKWCGKKAYFLTGDCLNHQALFANRECFNREKFDLNYRICADREWMIRVKKDGFRFENTDLIMCNYSLDYNSVSIKERELSDKEADKCIRTHFLWGYPIFRVLTFIRGNKLFSKMLHGVYRVLFIRKEKK